MKKIYIVRLSGEERKTCLAVVKKLKETSTKVRRANILLKADVDGPNWKDQQIADTLFCTKSASKTCESVWSPKVLTPPCTKKTNDSPGGQETRR